MCGTFLTTKYRMGLRKGKMQIASTSKERWTAVSRRMLLERRNAGSHAVEQVGLRNL